MAECKDSDLGKYTWCSTFDVTIENSLCYQEKENEFRLSGNV